MTSASCLSNSDSIARRTKNFTDPIRPDMSPKEWHDHHATRVRRTAAGSLLVLRCASAQLIPPGAETTGEVRHHASAVVDQDLQVRVGPIRRVLPAAPRHHPSRTRLASCSREVDDDLNLSDELTWPGSDPWGS